MSLADLGPAERHAAVAARFAELAHGVGPGGWDAPAPVAGWAARDVVRHLVAWFPGFLAAGTGIELPGGPPVDDDPAAAWEHQAAAVQGLFGSSYDGVVVRNPHLGEVPLPEAVDRFYTADVFLHSWDLARATGQDERLDEALCRQLYDGMVPLDAVLRASRQYGPAVPVPEDADVQTRLLGFIGRDVVGGKPQ